MSTDIHGCIETRHPHADEEWYEWEPWLRAIDLYPLLTEDDYAAFGCLFGVRDRRWPPFAGGRGLPVDASRAFRREYDEMRGLDPAVHSASWVDWAELAEIDLSVTVPSFRPDALPVTRRDVIGPGTAWSHVFAVMGVLADRFGKQGVRLVVYFDS